jgi:hypothetical protein
MQLSTRLVRVRTSLDARQSSLRIHHLRCSEGSGGLGRATTSLLLWSLQIKSLDRLLNQSVRGNHFLYSQSIMVIHANTNYCTHLSCSSWEDTTFRGTGHQRQVNCVLGSLMRMHYPGEVTHSDCTNSPAICWADYALAPDVMYGTAHGAVWSNLWVSFFKVLSLTQLTLLMLDFEIIEMIPLAKRKHARPHEDCVQEECSQARELIHIKWTDSRIKRVLADRRGAANGLVP